jgi:predicted DNA-binding transcriptional regulator AlpA
MPGLTGYLTIKQFCAEYAITRGMLYRLIAASNAPRMTSIGRRKLISRVAAEEWRRRTDGERTATAPAAPPPFGWFNWFSGGRQA